MRAFSVKSRAIVMGGICITLLVGKDQFDEGGLLSGIGTFII